MMLSIKYIPFSRDLRNDHYFILFANIQNLMETIEAAHFHFIDYSYSFIRLDL